jgi:phosphoglycerate dehydrogenase-like enzyme
VTDVIVIGDPADPSLRRLQEAPERGRFFVGLDALALVRQAPEAEVLLYCSGGKAPFEMAYHRMPRLRWVHSRWAGLDGLLFHALRETDVPLTNSKGVYSRALAEFTIGSILFFAKDFARMRRQQKATAWEPFLVEEVHGRTLGILGYGDIGRAIGTRAEALGMKVVPLRRADAADRLAALGACDYVALALPLTDETQGLFGAAEIAALRKTAVVVNVGRGPTLDEPALVKALAEGRIRGAALDVFAQEPLPASSPLWSMENVLISPHTADRTDTWLDEAMTLFFDNLGRFERGEPLVNVIADKRRGY